MGKFLTLSVESLQDATTETADGDGAEVRSSRTATSLEMWVNVTAVSGVSASAEFVLESSLDGIIFTEIGRTAAITAVGQAAFAVSRVDDALGVVVRARWEIAVTTTPSFDFDIKLGRRE